MTSRNQWFIALVGSIGLSASAFAVPVTPGGTSTGDSNNCIPVYCDYGAYQQVFDAASFGGASGIVSSIAFRLDETEITGSFSNLAANYEVHLSHTLASSSTLSTNFASNRGADDTIVLQGSHLYSATQLPGLVDNPFDFVLDLEDTFFYNGTGNLLLEIVPITYPSLFLALDARSGTSYTSRLFGSGLLGTGYGLVAQFELSPRAAVPEPASLALLGIGFGFLGLRRRRAN